MSERRGGGRWAGPCLMTTEGTEQDGVEKVPNKVRK